MSMEIVTKEDLQAFRSQLIGDIKQLLEAAGRQKENQWLKNSDVRKLLNISSNTIQRLRIAGKLKSCKVGGIHYYNYEDIQALLKGGNERRAYAG